MLGIKDEIPKKFRIFLSPFLFKPPRALRMTFFRHGWGDGSVNGWKREAGGGGKFLNGIENGWGIQFLAHGTKGEEI